MLPGCCIAALLFFLLRRRRKRRLAGRNLTSGPFREAGMFLLWLFSGGMAAITLCPHPSWLFAGLVYGYWTPYLDLANLGSRVSLLPFSDLDNAYNVIGNIVMFLPFGFFAALLWRGFNGKRAAALGLMITVCIECWQLFVGRATDVDDIILNTLGVFCGYWLWRLLKRCSPKFQKRFHVIENQKQI